MSGEWSDWITFSEEQAFVTARYVDVYDLGFDNPEGHVVERDDGVRFYSFFTRDEPIEGCLGEPCRGDEDFVELEAAGEASFTGTVELRGLEPDASYAIRRYPQNANEPGQADAAGTIALDDVSFDDEALFIVTPVTEAR